MIEISEEEYDELCRNSILLDCLRSAGVDNWDGWDFAIEQFHEILGEEND